MAEEFHWADYLVFAASLAISLGIGIFFAFSGSKQKTTDDFLLGGRDMNLVPVSLSILASSLNAVFILGAPAEIYYFGAIYSLVGLSFAIMPFLLAQIYVPVFHRMEMTSAYEYFERRYDFYPLRAAASATFIVSMLLFLAVVLYAPALAFSQVTGISLEGAVVTCGLVCTLYTALGGLKAVVWTDAVQMCIMVLGLIILTIMGGVEVGSASEIWKLAEDGGRLNFNNPDPRVRHTFWTQLIGQSFTWVGAMGANQMTIQRFFAIKKVRDAQLSVYISSAVGLVSLSLLTALGLVMYAHFHQCDPLLVGKITKGDQIVPFFLLEVMGHLHGLPGLFTAAVFAAALSSVSSAINSLAAVVLEDFIRPFYSYRTKKALSSKTAAWISKGLALGFGLFTIALSFLAEFMGAVILQIPATVWGVLASPILGIFTLGIFVRFSNGPGCLIGLLTAEAFGLWLSLGGIIGGNGPRPLPLGMECPDDPPRNFTPRVPPPPNDYPLQDFYQISYAWYGMICFLTTLLVGVVASIVVDGCKIKRRPVDPSLRSFNCASQCCCCLPEKYLHKLHLSPKVAPVEENSQQLEKKDLEMNGGIDNAAFDDSVEKGAAEKSVPDAEGDRSKPPTQNGPLPEDSKQIVNGSVQDGETIA